MPERAARPNQLVNATLGVCARDLERREFDAVRRLHRSHPDRVNRPAKASTKLCVARDQGLRTIVDSPPASIRAWAHRLLALEAANKSASDTDRHNLLRVFGKLRIALTQFVGADGFTALIRRALALARREVPSLQTAKVTPEGRLEGIEENAADAKYDSEATIAITAHLLALLVTFINEPLTLRLMSDLWRDEADRTTTESEDLK